MRRLIAGLAALACAGVVACQPGSPPRFTDNFDTLNTTMWGTYDGHTNEKAGPRSSANITLGRDTDGTTYARLWTRPTNGHYASAGIQLHLAQRYGTYTVRTRSYSYGAGNKYAVMIWPTPNCWPCAETDFNESWDPGRKSYMITNHFQGPDGKHGMIHHGVVLDLTQWHTFTLQWTPGLDVYLVDGREIWRSTAQIPTVPMSLVLQTGLTGAPNPVPAVLDVDYVQVWSYP